MAYERMGQKIDRINSFDTQYMAKYLKK